MALNMSSARSAPTHAAHPASPKPMVPHRPSLTEDEAQTKGCITAAADRTVKNIASTQQKDSFEPLSDIHDGGIRPESDTSSDATTDATEKSHNDETDDTSLDDPEADAIYQEAFEPRLKVRTGPGAVIKHFGAKIDTGADGNFVAEDIAEILCEEYGARRFKSSSTTQEYELATGQPIRVQEFVKIFWMRERANPKDSWLESKFYILQNSASGAPHAFDFLIGKPGINQMGGPAALTLQKISDRQELSDQDTYSLPEPVHPRESLRLRWRTFRATFWSRLKLNRQHLFGSWRPASPKREKRGVR